MSSKIGIVLETGGSWVEEDGLSVYRPRSSRKPTVGLRRSITYSKLLNGVAKKLSLVDSVLKLSFQMRPDSDVIPIADDEDVGWFLQYVETISPAKAKLFVELLGYDGSGANRSGYEGSEVMPQRYTEVVDLNVMPQFFHDGGLVDVPTYEQGGVDFMPQYNHEHGLVDVPVEEISNWQSYQNEQFRHPTMPQYNEHVRDYTHTFGIGTSQNQNEEIGIQSQPEYNEYVTEFVTTCQDGTSHGAEEMPTDRDGTPKRAEEVVDDLFEAVETKALFSDAFEALGFSDDDVVGIKEGDEDEVEDDVSEEDDVKPTRNPFLFMPKPLPPPDSEFTTSQPTMSYTPSPRVKLGDFFKTKEELKLNLGLKCVEEGFQMRTERSSKKMLDARCYVDGCSWRVLAVLQRYIGYWEVRKFEDRHSCKRTQLHPRHRNATEKVLGNILADQFTQHSRIYRGAEIVQDINARFKISISYKQAWRAKVYALKLLWGTDAESFARLPVYCHNLKKVNPGTVTHIETDDVGRFELFFVAIGASLNTFRNQMRPLIIIDGAHLKGGFLGTMFLAVVMDGNNKICPIAFGVGKSESGMAWTWFLQKLKECVGPMVGGAFISDRAHAIALAIQTVFPDAHHGLCCRHLCMNLRLKTKKAKAKE